MNIPIQYPPAKFKLKEQDGKQYIYDVFRKKYIVLTPEEWVRQNILSALVQVYNYPAGLIAVEKLLLINQLKRRFDAVIYDNDRQPWMLIECKAPDVNLSAETLNQSLNYYRILQCKYLMISNGAHTQVAEITASSFCWIAHIPAYNL